LAAIIAGCMLAVRIRSGAWNGWRNPRRP
jgi:hypothetical protein